MKIKKIISALVSTTMIGFVVLPVSLCSCGNSDSSIFEDSVSEERYEEITKAICTACIQPMLSTQLYADYNYESQKNPYEITNMYDTTLIDLSTVKVKKIGNVYKSGGALGFNVKFCGVDMEFKKIGESETTSVSFTLMLTSGMYNYAKVSAGYTDTRMTIDQLTEFVNNYDDMLSAAGKKSDIKVDYYSTSIKVDRLNKILSEKLEKYMSNVSDSNSNKISETYKAILESYDRDYGNLPYREYFISDIDNNDVPELIVHIGGENKGIFYDVITYKDNSGYFCGEIDVSSIGTEQNNNILYESDDGLYFDLNGEQSHSIVKLTLDSNFNGTTEPSEIPSNSKKLQGSDFSDFNLLFEKIS